MTRSNKLLTALAATAGALGTAPAGASPESRPLLAANGRPACGNVLTKGPRPGRDALLAMRVAARNTLVEHLVWLEAEYPDSRTAIRGSRKQLAVLGDCVAELAVTPAVPLLTVDGRPACGNVQSKGGPEMQQAMWADERQLIVTRLRSPVAVDGEAEVRRLGELEGCLASVPM